MRVLLLALLCSCSVVDSVESGAASAGGHVAEFVACPTSLVDCGHVYLCAKKADNPLGHVETCINDDDDPDALARAEKLFGACEPTPRHEGLCLYHCDGGAGCNAYGKPACFCPEAP